MKSKQSQVVVNTTLNNAGQAIIEYVLLLSMIISMTSLMIAGVRSNRDKMWKRILCEVSAACPDCQSTPSAKAALPQSGFSCKH